MKMLSLFSGIGAFERAAINKGIKHEIINYCEIDKYASYAYSILHNEKEENNLWDVSKVDGTKYKDIDLITYGFPCQDISLAGERKGIIKGKTKSGLLFEALRIISESKPKVAIAENVKNLVSKMFINDFNNLIGELDKLGYNSYWKVINGINHNTAHSRERVFIVSIRKDIDNGTFEFIDGSDELVTLESITDKVIDEKYYCKDNEYIKCFINNIQRKVCDFKSPSEFGLVKIGDINNPNIREMNRRVFSELGASPTLVTGSDSIPKILQCRVRRLTPLECWKLVGFTNEDYWNVRKALEKRFYYGRDMTDTQMYKMAGNSIVIKVAESIFESLEGIIY
ncbi:MAG: DNA (cytosine-5-)-methyltransferase [Clostridium sp.]|uniref:DNA (cytosine-5-)-methyltransferase n=1 Tax=Clostridium sp. TaxID=1506 RepID=UPI002910F5B5|nr:DNA (cytosine-5-)-methyltransferase [Clostridium sp.]MDU4428620.1 DNA (cytosine-5-)-methyltransferase [Clostridium sp.]MDU7460483.1 DNA (cytosine-5-)-methyltransferase [Clostridium sp.]